MPKISQGSACMDVSMAQRVLKCWIHFKICCGLWWRRNFENLLEFSNYSRRIVKHFDSIHSDWLQQWLWRNLFVSHEILRYIIRHRGLTAAIISWDQDSLPRAKRQAKQDSDHDGKYCGIIAPSPVWYMYKGLRVSPIIEIYLIIYGALPRKYSLYSFDIDQ